MNFLKLICYKLIKINDSPQRIALGFAIGVFTGILPSTGPVAALILSLVFRVNRIAALTGSLLTNTWLSVATFVLAAKIGSFVTKTDWQNIYNAYRNLLADFEWRHLFDAAILKLIYPLIMGYVLIGLMAGASAYFFAVSFLKVRGKFYVAKRVKSNQ